LRLQHDGAYAFLEKSELALDKGCEKLLMAVAKIVRDLGFPVPERMEARGAGVA
jgi:hypothetical protein